LQQYDIVEKKNRILLEHVRSLALENDVVRFLWIEAINIVAYLLNKSPTYANS
jgi:hypothetical protein